MRATLETWHTMGFNELADDGPTVYAGLNGFSARSSDRFWPWVRLADQAGLGNGDSFGVGCLSPRIVVTESVDLMRLQGDLLL
jgi:hypothetical protein